MSTRTITILLVTAIIGLGAVLFVVTRPKTDNEQTQTEGAQTTNTTSNVNQKTYTASEVESHNTAKDCWTIINNSVYNITSYVPRHPGGDEILRACGADATTMFESRKTESGEEIGSGTPHSSSAEQQLTQLKIGTLTQ